MLFQIDCLFLGYLIFSNNSQNNSSNEIPYENIMKLIFSNPSHPLPTDISFWENHKIETALFRVDNLNSELIIGWYTCEKEFDNRNYPVSSNARACVVNKGEENSYLDCICYYAIDN